MKRASFLLVALFLLTIAATASRAGITIQMKQDGKPMTSYIEEHRFRTEFDGMRMIFRGDKKVLWTVDAEKQSYTELTEEGAKALGKQISEAMSKMQEAMKNIPPEQRAMMEKMMGEQMKGANVEVKRTVTPMGQNRIINGFPCDGYKVRSGVGEGEIWCTDLSNLKLQPKDFAVFKEMAEFMKAMTGGMEGLSDLAKDFENPTEEDVPGLPVLTIYKDDGGKERSRTELVGVDRGAVQADRFEIPAGFKKESR